MYSHESTGALKELFQWSLVDPSDIDEEKYLLSKKISEVSQHGIHKSMVTDRTLDGLHSRPPSRRAT